MRRTRPLDGVFTSLTSTRILRVLAASPEKSFTSRELASAAHAPAHRALEVLARLELEGLVRSRVVGRAYFWTTNPRHPLLPALSALFAAEGLASAALVALLEEGLAAVRGLRRAAIFGSAARGEERSDSDLDLFLLFADARAKADAETPVGELTARANEVFGTRVRALMYTESEYRRGAGLPVVQAVEREGIPLRLRGVRA